VRPESGLLLVGAAGRAGDVIAGTGPAATVADRFRSFVRSLFTAGRTYGTVRSCRSSRRWVRHRTDPARGSHSHIGRTLDTNHCLNASRCLIANRRESTHPPVPAIIALTVLYCYLICCLISCVRTQFVLPVI